MQGVKACLGWDRQPSGGVHSCTVVVDTWLKLFQRSLHAVRALRLTLPPLPELPDGRCACVTSRGSRGIVRRACAGLRAQVCVCDIAALTVLVLLT